MTIIATNGVELCVRTYGDPDAPPVLMVQGAGESLISWPDELCERLAAGGRHVITFDTRDTGESTSFPVGAPPYGLRDLVADTAGLIAALGLPAVHLVGLSQGAAVCQLLALEHPENVLSLTLTCSTPGGPGHAYDDLPPMSADLAAFFSGALAEPDWTDRAAVIDYLVAVYRPFASPARTFDEAGMREFAGRVFDRTKNLAGQLTNPFLIDAGEPWRDQLGKIHVPTLILHGADDPLVPVEHGAALAAEIPDARLVVLEQTGHEVFPPHTWDLVVATILGHTS